MTCVYLLRCADGTFYTGWTVNLEKRLAAHNAGTGSRYTRGRRPLRLVYWEELATESQARQREPALRQLSHARKERMSESANQRIP